MFHGKYAKNNSAIVIFVYSLVIFSIDNKQTVVATEWGLHNAAHNGIKTEKTYENNNKKWRRRRRRKSETNKLLLLIAICINIIQVSFCSDKYIIYSKIFVVAAVFLFLFRSGVFILRPSARVLETRLSLWLARKECLRHQRNLQFVSDYTSTFLSSSA